ncbi:MAG: hypothetical protein MH137_09995 [Flavobacteriales bacterium]|nr:hypothetical protein [Flavobacteriales bacterium]
MGRFASGWIIVFLFAGIFCASAQGPYRLHMLADSAEIKSLTSKEQFSYDNRFTGIQARHKEIQRVLLIMYDMGYLAATADSMGGDSLSLTVHINRGIKYTKTRIRPGNVDLNMLSNSNLKDKLLYNEPFSPRKITALLKKILSRYENNGYPFASVSTDSVEISGENISFSIKVDKGPKVVIDSLIISGNALLKKSFLHGYLGVKPGQLYNEKQLSQLNTKLRQLPYIQVTQPQRVIFTEPGKANVFIYAKKVNASRFSGLIGFMPGSADGRLLITGEADLSLKNALGYGEQLTLRWRRIRAGTQSLNAQATYPYLFGTPLAINGFFNFFRRDSTFQNIDFGVGVRYMFVGTSYLELFYKRQISQVINVANVPQQALTRSIDYTANNIGLTLNLEKYDYRLNPTSGYLLNTTLWGGNKTMRTRKDVPPEVYENVRLNTYQIGGELKADVFIRLHKRITLKPGILLAHSENPYRFYNELLRMGGINNLRGFDEEGLYLSSYAFGNVELRYLIEQNSNVYLFFNGGWGERRTTENYLRDTPYGFGAGMNFFTKAGIINFAYGLGSQQGQAIRFRDGKIHLGFTGVF